MALNLLDTTVLSNFAHAQRLDLLQLALGESAATTPTVMAELRTGEASGLVPRCDWTWLPVLVLSHDEQQLAATLSSVLDPGECECIAVAFLRGATILSDDFSARRIAHGRKLPVSGTIGVLLLLVEENHLSFDEADTLLLTMIGNGYRSPVTSLGDLT